MSRAVAGEMPKSGIAVPGSIDCGDVIHRRRFLGVFGTSPAMYVRSDHLSNGGPALPSAPVTPGIEWQVPHPSCASSEYTRRAASTASLLEASRLPDPRTILLSHVGPAVELEKVCGARA